MFPSPHGPLSIINVFLQMKKLKHREKLSNLVKVTPLVNGRAGIQAPEPYAHLLMSPSQRADKPPSWILLMERPMDLKKRLTSLLLAWTSGQALELTQVEREKMGGAVQEPRQLLR